MNIKYGMILAAGLGKRMQPLTLKTPKPLLEINNYTLLERAISLLIGHGVQEISINVHYLPDQIKSFINRKKFKVKITISNEENLLLDTGGGVLKGTQNFGDNPFFVINPDTVWSKHYLAELKSLEAMYLKNNKPTLLLVNKKLSIDPSFKGDFNLNNANISKDDKNQFIGITHSLSPNILFLDNSSKLINLGEDSISIVSSKDINGKKLKSSDPSRDLTNFISKNSNSGLLKTLNDQKSLVNNVVTSGMVMSAAILVGLSRKILDLATAYTLDRKQFGKPVGSFQAVKHMLAQAAIEIEFSKATLYRAAYSLDKDNPLQKLHAAQAKLQAIDACEMVSRNSMQAHGAMGYTWEMDLHIFIRRGWSYKQVWGNKSLLENYIMNQLEKDLPKLGSTYTFL